MRAGEAASLVMARLAVGAAGEDKEGEAVGSTVLQPGLTEEQVCGIGQLHGCMGAGGWVESNPDCAPLGCCSVNSDLLSLCQLNILET